MISNLEFDTTYHIYAIAIQKEGIERKTLTSKVTTLNKLYLYQKGDNYEELIGGWRYTGYHSNAGGTYINNENGIYLSVPWNYRVFYGTYNMIDLTDYSKLYIKNEGTMKICQISKTSYFNNSAEKDIWYDDAIDISEYKGEYYIHLTVANGGTAKVTEVYLEK